MTQESQLMDFERSAPVSLVSTADVVTCNQGDPARIILTDRRYTDFDHFPVVADGKAVGVLTRPDRWEDEIRDETVDGLMEPIRLEMLVARSDPLIGVIERMSEGPAFRLVLELGEVRGMLTLADLGRLPSRAIMFARITHLEMLLGAFIRAYCHGHDGAWLGLITAGRRAKLEATYSSLKSRRENLDLVSAAQFCDKRVACCRLGLSVPGLQSGVSEALERFERLRDLIAHAMSGFHEGERARETARTVRDLGTCIDSLAKQVGELEATTAKEPIG